MKKILSVLLVFLTTIFLVSCQRDNYFIYFDVQGGTPEVAKQEVKSGEFANHPEEEVTKEGYSFAFWYDRETSEQFMFEITEVRKDYILEAYWNELPGNGNGGSDEVNEYKVTFTSRDDNNTVTDVIVKEGNKVSKPSDPVKTNHEFIGWFTDLDLTVEYDFYKSINSNLTLYAKWEETLPIKEFTVTYITNGGSSIDSEKVNEGQKLTKPNNPSKDNNVFEGWYTDLETTKEYDFNNLVENDFTLYAKWRVREQGDLLDYYQGYGIEDAVGEDLSQALKKRLNKDAVFHSYGGGLNKYFFDMDKHQTDKNSVYTVYDGASMLNSVIDKGQSGDDTKIWNKEHMMPQSWYTGKYSNRKGDLHNLRAANKKINSIRGNMSYADGSGNWSVVSGGFYPGDGHQGDSARIAMYMIVMLPDVIPVNKAFAGPNPVQTMLKWHNEDPVDDFEIRRNEIIFGYQKNRNPFIDHPEFAELIWGGMTYELTQETKLSNLISSINLVTNIVVNQEVYVPNTRFYF